MYIVSKNEQTSVKKELDRILKDSNIVYCFDISHWSEKSTVNTTIVRIGLQKYKHESVAVILNTDKYINRISGISVQVMLHTFISDLKECNSPRDLIAMFCSVKDFAKYAKAYEL